MGVILGIIILFGIYKLATSNLSQHSSLTPTTKSSQRISGLKIFLYIFFTILLFLAVFTTYHIFITQ